MKKPKKFIILGVIVGRQFLGSNYLSKFNGCIQHFKLLKQVKMHYGHNFKNLNQSFLHLEYLSFGCNNIVFI
jgi:hypothetical protein